MVKSYSVGGLAQLVRVPASHAGGRRFEPASPHQAVCGMCANLQPHMCKDSVTFICTRAILKQVKPCRYTKIQAPLWRGFKYMVKITEGSRVFKYKEIAI